MILQALQNYYLRKASQEDSDIAPAGLEWKELPFLVVISPEGKFLGFEDTREGEGKNKRAKRFLIPQAVKKTSGIKANLFWDNPEYLLGIPIKGNAERVAEQHTAFIARIIELKEAIPKALMMFLENMDRQQILNDPLWKEIQDSAPFMTFKISGEVGPIASYADVQQAFVEHSLPSGEGGLCIISGTKESIEELHPSIKGVRGAQSVGANIISFNADTYESFGKKKGYNSPVGKTATFQYITALNALLSKDSKQKLQIGDATTVFWAEKAIDLETQIVDIFGEPEKDNPESNIESIKNIYRSVETGFYSDEVDIANKFFILGLSPNAARISVRFWHVISVNELALNIKQHFDDTSIIHGSKEPDHLSLFRMLVNLATEGKADNIVPLLSGDFMRSILNGTPYPSTLLQAAVRRNKAEQKVNYARACLIKAIINRKTRYSNPTIKEELKMSLDETNKNTGYRLGRLFAALEKIQAEAHPGLNATIRDRYYGAASGTPVTVFPILMRMKNHHISKLENKGRAINLEKMLAEIIDGISDFPAHLPIEDQGRFAIGYYHQTQKFYQKNIKEGEV
jgi:CRISPR-associated protein Csd1